jgi:hypothetical protein
MDLGVLLQVVGCTLRLVERIQAFGTIGQF